MEPVVGIGPVSRTTVDAALTVARRTRTPLMLIPSRRQVDAAEFGGGYLGWTTDEFAAYVREHDTEGLTLLCRDHGGPWMHTAEATLTDPAEAMASCLASFTADLDAGFGLLHIDTSEGRPGTGPAPAREAAERLVELYARCHAEATARGVTVAYEIGFEPQDVDTNDPDEFKAALRSVLEGIEAAGAPRPRYVVAQTGTKVAELRNVGRFHRPGARSETLRQVSTLAAICHQEGVLLKAHNCDYLTVEETALLLRAGVDAFNVAPEYGVTETRALLRVLDEMALPRAKEDFLRLAHDSGKWRKWLLEPSTATDVERAVIAGHYVFRTDEGLRIRAEAAHALSRRGRPPLETVLREAVAERIGAALRAVAAARTPVAAAGRATGARPVPDPASLPDPAAAGPAPRSGTVTAAGTRASAPETLQEAVDRVLRVPDEHRTFTKDAAFAEETWAIGPGLLEALLDHGLPHRGPAGRRRFERTDLHNISTYLNLPSPYFRALARKARAMDEAARSGEPHRHRLELTAQCAGPGHAAPCAFEPVPGLAAHSVPGSLRHTAPGTFTVEARLPSDTYVFDDDRSELLSLVADWELYVLPDGVIEDEDFSRRTRLANCLIPTRLLLREAARRGIRARHGAGLLVAPPFTTLHHWIEFELDGVWRAADPVLLTAFARWGMTDPAAWPYNRSVAGIVWHLLTWPPEVFFPVVRDHGRQAPLHITAR